MMQAIKKMIRRVLSDDFIKKIKAWLRRLSPTWKQGEVDALYRLLYNAMHDHEQSLDLTARQTVEAFSDQWEQYPEGEYMLSDPWFRDNLQRILTREMILIDQEWFKGKRILDAGCGNGRWSHGLASMGAHMTCVDINRVALEETEKALKPFEMEKRFIQTPLEGLDEALPDEQFDMVYSFGVIHHCNSFNTAFENVISKVEEGGVLFLYLYGRESLSMEEDIELFKERIKYNSLTTRKEKEAYLLKRVGGDSQLVHQKHDLLAPLVNRRLEFDDIRSRLEARGFTQIERTMDHTELFIRAFKGKNIPEETIQALLPKHSAPFWFQHHG